MRIKFDKKKSEQLRNDPRRKIGFEEAQELFDDVFIEDQQIDYPHQWRATGWVCDRKISYCLLDHLLKIICQGIIMLKT